MIELPCTVETFVAEALEPALKILPPQMDSPEARVLVTAIALQESGLAKRWQVADLARPDIKGPARGLLQFEKGGVAGVVRHQASRYWLWTLCKARGCRFETPPIWSQLELDDVLAAGVARLLLFTDPKRLPEVDDEAGAWALYLRCWRPGKPRPDHWAANHARAGALVAA